MTSKIVLPVAAIIGLAFFTGASGMRIDNPIGRDTAQNVAAIRNEIKGFDCDLRINSTMLDTFNNTLSQYFCDPASMNINVLMGIKGLTFDAVYGPIACMPRELRLLQERVSALPNNEEEMKLLEGLKSRLDNLQQRVNIYGKVADLVGPICEGEKKVYWPEQKDCI